MSKLLINEYPLLIPPTLAVAIGLNEAIIIQQIHYWVDLFKRANDRKHYQDGEWWVWNTIPEWQANFPFMSERTVRRTLRSLRNPYQAKKNDTKVTRGPLLITGEYNRAGYDRTLWYRIDYEELERIEKIILPEASGQNGHMPYKPSGQNGHMTGGQSGHMSMAKMDRPIPETTRDNSTTTTPSQSDETSHDVVDVVVVSLKGDQRKSYDRLTSLGVDIVTANELAQKYPWELVEYWAEIGFRKRDLENRSGYVISKIRTGVMPPPEPEPEPEPERPERKGPRNIGFSK